MKFALRREHRVLEVVISNSRNPISWLTKELRSIHASMVFCMPQVSPTLAYLQQVRQQPAKGNERYLHSEVAVQ